MRSNLEVGTKIIHERIKSQPRKSAMNINAKNPIQNPQASFGFASNPTKSRKVIKMGITHRGKACNRTRNGELTFATYF